MGLLVSLIIADSMGPQKIHRVKIAVHSPSKRSRIIVCRLGRQPSCQMEVFTKNVVSL